MLDNKVQEQYFSNLFEKGKMEVPLSLQVKLDQIPDNHRVLDWGKIVPLVIGIPALIVFLFLHGESVVDLLSRSAGVLVKLFVPSTMLFGLPLVPFLIVGLLLTGGLVQYYRNVYSLSRS